MLLKQRKNKIIIIIIIIIIITHTHTHMFMVDKHRDQVMSHRSLSYDTLVTLYPDYAKSQSLPGRNG